MSACAYCGVARGGFTDHLITRSQARRNIAAAKRREDARYKVRACRECNEAKGTRLRVPPALAHLIPEIEALTGGVYAVFDGSAKSLRKVVR